MSKSVIILCALACVVNSQVEALHYERRLEEVKQALANGQQLVREATEKILKKEELLVNLNRKISADDAAISEKLNDLPKNVKELLDETKAKGADIDECNYLVNYLDVQNGVKRVLGNRQLCVYKHTEVGRSYVYRAKNDEIDILNHSNVVVVRAETCLRNAIGPLADAARSTCIGMAEDENGIIANMKIPSFITNSNVIINELDRLAITGQITCIANEAHNLINESLERVKTCTDKKIKELQNHGNEEPNQTQ